MLEEDNIRPGTPYYYLTKLAAKCTAKPHGARLHLREEDAGIKVDQNGEGQCYTCMGCRSFLTPYVDPETGKPKYYGRFNQGVVTINLVDVALSSGGDREKFWKVFDERLELCYRALMCRHERLKGTLSDAAPILWQYGALARLKKGEPIDQLLYGGYSTISLGYAGLYECVKYMTGQIPHRSGGHALCPGGHAAHEPSQRRLEGQGATSTSPSTARRWSPPPTSSPSACKSASASSRASPTSNYITNSYHVHVTEQIDAFSKLNFESPVPGPLPRRRHQLCGGAQHAGQPRGRASRSCSFIYDNIMYAELNTKSDYCQVLRL